MEPAEPTAIGTTGTTITTTTTTTTTTTSSTIYIGTPDPKLRNVVLVLVLVTGKQGGSDEAA